MKTIHKFVLKAYLGPMILTFFIVMFVLLMNFVWRYIDELVGKGLSTGIIIELFTYAMANMIPMGLPLAMLLAAIMTMGNLGENYELLAMKSAGMSLLQITKPLIILTAFIAVGSFFITNNLVPYANRKMFSIIFDIRQQKQALEFQDGLFFNGIENMSIRVERQDPGTNLLHDVLIYDNRAVNGNMNTVVADSGYIRLSDDKRYLHVILYNGETYEQTRNSQWFNKSALRHHRFDVQEQKIAMDGFAMGRTDANLFSNSQTKNINELQQDIDSLERTVNGVPNNDVLFSSIMLSSNASQRSSERGAQSTPLPSLSMKLTISGVIFSAATMKSPSFSRSSSSTTMTIFPFRKSSMTSSTLFNTVSFAMTFVFDCMP